MAVERGWWLHPNFMIFWIQFDSSTGFITGRSATTTAVALPTLNAAFHCIELYHEECTLKCENRCSNICHNLRVDLSQGHSSILKYSHSKMQNKIQNLMRRVAVGIFPRSSKSGPYLPLKQPLVKKCFQKKHQWSYFQLSWTCFWLY